MQGPLPITTVASSSSNAWELEAALGRAKLFLIGSPYASDFCFSDAVGGPLQVWHAAKFCDWSRPSVQDKPLGCESDTTVPTASVQPPPRVCVL